jgi:hypothetical protein
MTTGRINQVTILSRSPREAPANRPQSGRQSSVLEGRCGKRPAPSVPGARATTGPQGTIQLPPLCSPRGGPRHHRSGARRRHGVSHATLRRRLPSAGHARSGYQPGLAPECLADNGGHRPVIHRLLRYWRLSPPDFRAPSASSLPSRAGSQA